MKRHASTDELADLAAGVLKPRKAAKISGHLSGCAYCTGVSNQLADVSSLLASVPVAPIPANLSSRIESAIASESAQRLASEPGTEAGRRDLPTSGRRSHRAGQSRGWRIPALSGPASRLVAAAGALAIIGGGGYEIATHVNTGTSGVAGSAAGSVTVPPTSRMSWGPRISYPQGRVTKSLLTVTTDTNFTRPTLGKLAVAALTAARRSGAAASSGTTPSYAHSSPAATTGTRGTPNANANYRGPGQDQLTGCVDQIAAGHRVLLVELAYFDHLPATIIVTASAKSGSADVWAVRRSCTDASTQLLSHVTITHT
jgi:hypothetical protein